MSLKVEDVVKIDALKEELHSGLQQLDQTLRGVFGQLSYSLITVVDRYNALEVRSNALEVRYHALEVRYHALEAEHQALKGQVATLAERLLHLEQQRGGPH